MATMKAAVYVEPGSMEIREVQVPEVGPMDVLLKVRACGICGSDLHSYRLGFYVEPGQVMGHEFVGEVVEAGSALAGVEPGQRAMGFTIGICGTCYWCQSGALNNCPQAFKGSTGYGKPGAFAEYVKIENAMPGLTFHPIPEGMSDEEAATLEPVGVAAFAAEMSGAKEGDKVAVLGAGLIGNATMQAMKAVPVEMVVVSEIAPLRMRLAGELGADTVIDAANEDVLERMKEELGVGPYHFGEGAMADIVVDAAGARDTFAQALEIVRSAGTVALVGLPEGDQVVNTTRIVHKSPRIIGCLGSIYPKAIELIGEGKVKTAPLITHTFPLEEINEAFRVQMDPEESIKVLVKP
ncbi:MAG: alcohol dehydrogenase catalytic domain-containing protein [Actinomycetota bacterium]